MIRRIKFAASVCALMGSMGLGGCASVFEGTSQEIAVGTSPSGATCEFERDGKAIGTINKTPGSLVVRKSKYDITIKCNKPGYLEASYLNHSGLSTAVAANIVVDVLFTAGIASIVDSANGADNKYQEAVNITLVEAPAATAGSTPPAASADPAAKAASNTPTQ